MRFHNLRHGAATLLMAVLFHADRDPSLELTFGQTMQARPLRLKQLAFFRAQGRANFSAVDGLMDDC